MNSIIYNEGHSQEDEGRRLKSSAFQIDHSGPQFLCLQECSSSKGSYPSVPRLDHTEQMWRGYQSEGDNAAGRYRRQYIMRHSDGLACGLTI